MLILILIGGLYVDVKRKKRSESYLKRMFKGSKAGAPAPPGTGRRTVNIRFWWERKNRGGIRTIWNNPVLRLLCLKPWTKNKKYEFLSWYFFVSSVAAEECWSSFEMASTSICCLFSAETFVLLVALVWPLDWPWLWPIYLHAKESNHLQQNTQRSLPGLDLCPFDLDLCPFGLDLVNCPCCCPCITKNGHSEPCEKNIRCWFPPSTRIVRFELLFYTNSSPSLSLTHT